jgi:hypothetical protein
MRQTFFKNEKCMSGYTERDHKEKLQINISLEHIYKKIASR